MKFLSKLLLLLVIPQADRRSLVRLRLRLLKIEEDFKSKEKDGHQFLNAIVEIFQATYKWHDDQKIDGYIKFINYFSWISSQSISDVIQTLRKIDIQLKTFYDEPHFSIRLKNGENEINDNTIYFGDKARGKNITYLKKLACPDRSVNRRIVESTRKLSMVLVPEIDILFSKIKL